MPIKVPESLLFFLELSPQDKVKCLAVTRDNTFLISGSSDLSIKVFDIEKKKDVHTFKNIHDGNFNPLFGLIFP